MVSSPANKQLASHQAEATQKQKEQPILICIDDDDDDDNNDGDHNYNEDKQASGKRVLTVETDQTAATPARAANNRLQRRLASQPCETPNHLSNHTADDEEPNERVEDGIIGMKVRTPNRTSTS